MSKARLSVMVSSAVYGNEALLEQIYALLTNLGYEVWMSYKGTIPVDCDRDTVECCLDAVRRCDLFFGVITTNYGTTKRDELSATHLEFREAIRLNKPRWFVVEDRVFFARRILKNIFLDPDKRVTLLSGRERIYFKDGKSAIDFRVMDMYEEARQLGMPNAPKSVHWVQEFSDDASALLFADAQFSRPHELMKLIEKRMRDTLTLKARIARKTEVDE